MHYLARRTSRLIAVFLIATFFSFCLLNLVPGDIIDALLGNIGAEDHRTARQQLEKEMGLDQPIFLRYFSWLGHLATGDFGRSAITSQPVAEALLQRIPATLELIVLSQIIAISLAVPLGILSAYRPNGWFDQTVSIGTFVLLSIPQFITGVILLFSFAVLLKLLPAAGYVPIWENILLNLKGYILPATTIALLEAALVIRVLRSDMITVLQEDYITFARAKGLSAPHILLRHALRPALFNVVTVLGLQVGSIVSAAIVTEQLFSLPGLGSLLIQAVQSHDNNVVLGVVVVMVLLSVGVNLLVDSLYVILDPRVTRLA